MKYVGIVCAVLVLAVMVGVGAVSSGGWSPDFTNTSWGPLVGGLVGAIVTGVLGVMLRGRIEAELDRKRGGLMKEVQTAIEQEKFVLLREVEREKIALAAETQKGVEMLRAALTREGAEDAARRDYRYEAKKKLYQQCEPLIFQLRELAEHAQLRVFSLARSARQGSLREDANGWLAGDGYYMQSTIYVLLAPAVLFKILQRQLTTVDMALDTRINAVYQLSKRYYRTFTEDYELAQAAPSLRYDPYGKGSQEERQRAPQECWKQGITWGKLDNAVEALIVTDDKGVSRCKSFGVFQIEWSSQEPVRTRFEPLFDLLYGFHPKQRPVFWRLLVAQAHVCAAIIEAAGAETVARLMMPRLGRERLRWAEGDEDEAELEPLAVAANHLATHLREIWAPPARSP